MLWQMATMTRPLLVADGAPLRDVAVLLVGAARVDVLLAGHLEALADVVQHVKNLVAVGQVRDRILIGRQHHPHAAQEALPVGRAVEIVHHEEAALEQVLAQALGLRSLNVQLWTWTAYTNGILKMSSLSRSTTCW